MCEHCDVNIICSCVFLASKPQWKSRPQRKRHRSGNTDDDETDDDAPVQTRKDSNLGFMTAKDQYVSILSCVYHINYECLCISVCVCVCVCVCACVCAWVCGCT